MSRRERMPQNAHSTLVIERMGVAWTLLTLANRSGIVHAKPTGIVLP